MTETEPSGNQSKPETTDDFSAVSEVEAQRSAALWATLSAREKQLAMAYVGHNMSWRNCVTAFKLGNKANLMRMLKEISDKLGGGDLRRLAK